MPGTSRAEQRMLDSTMELPDDADLVLSTLRLGWYVAEVRGRNRPDPPPGARAELPGRGTYALPVEVERTATEQRIQAQAVLSALADKLGVNADPDDGSEYCKEVNSQAERLAALRADRSDDAVAAWDTLAQLFYRFDAYIQDSLSAKSDMQADGYRLGRALAECYWALDVEIPNATQSPAAWWFLLGEERCAEMSRLLGRLSKYWEPYTAPVIASSLMVWKDVAANSEWRGDAYSALYRQVCVWYELMVLSRDPTTSIGPGAHLPYSWVIRKTMRSLWVPITLITAGTAALVTLIVLLGSGEGSAVANILLAILSATGVSVGGLSVLRLRQDLFTDLTAVAIITAPVPPAAVVRRHAGSTRTY